MNTQNFDLRLNHYNIVMVNSECYDYFLTDWNGKYTCRLFIAADKFVEGFEVSIVDAIESAINKLKQA